jgi:hypothetical protein
VTKSLFRAVVLGHKPVEDAVTGKPVPAGEPVVMLWPDKFLVSRAGLAELAKAFDDPAARLPGPPVVH